MQLNNYINKLEQLTNKRVILLEEEQPKKVLVPRGIEGRKEERKRIKAEEERIKIERGREKAAGNLDDDSFGKLYIS